MTELEERPTKKLAELKSYLEKKVAENEEEVRTLRSFLEIVDNLLTERSYRRMEVTSRLTETAEPRETREGASQAVTTMAGVQLANIYVENKDMRIVPSPTTKFDVNSAPFKTFLLGKVLEPMRLRDTDAVRRQELAPDDVISYSLDQEGNILKELHIRNFGDQRRLNEIRNGVRWTLRKIYEKNLGT